MDARKRRAGRLGRAKMRSPRAASGFASITATALLAGDRRMVARVRTRLEEFGYHRRLGSDAFRECGGMPPSQLAPSAPPPTGRYLSLIDRREQIALLRAQRQGVREIARHLARSARQRSRANFDATPRLAAVDSNIARSRHSGMPIAPHDVPSLPNWLSMLH